MQDFNTFFLRNENALANNLPIPIPTKTQDNAHTYVGVIDVVANMLASARPVERFDDMTAKIFLDGKNILPTVSTSKAAYDLLLELKSNSCDENEFTLYLWMKEWRDDFDPSHTKSNRAQIHMSTFTICPNKKDPTNASNTYIMSLSSKRDDHTGIEEILAEEMHVLREGKYFYHGGLKQLIKVKVGLLCTNVDRPKRTKIFQVGDHNGKYSSCWGYAAYVDSNMKVNHLPNCHDCRKDLIKNIIDKDSDKNTIIDCKNGKCSQWNLLNNNYNYPAPKTFPTVYDKTPGAPLPPLHRVPGDDK